MKRLLFLIYILPFFSSAQEHTRDLTAENWQFKNSKDTQWLQAEVPGTVHQDLMSHDKIPDPYLDLNEEPVQWVEQEDWEYRTGFNLTASEWENEHIDLVFDGLDTYAEVYLNQQLILSADNMFRRWEVPVQSYLKKGKNQLVVRFRSAVKKGEELARQVPFETPETPRAFVRKAQYQFGWDWGPRLVTAGIWKKVALQYWNRSKIDHIQIEQKQLTDKAGVLNFNIKITTDKPGRYELQVNDQSYSVELTQGTQLISRSYTVQNPQRWQPNGWGEARLYDFKISLLQDGQEISSRRLRHGFRTLELVREKDSIGSSFYFLVNGKPLYAKGANWIPGDSFLPRMNNDRYQTLIAAARDAHMNMIRVWGGGIYEADAFYEACDENGILVWQDLMFAGSFYPADEHFLNNVKKEVEYQVNRLQNHPCIALWCGNNEIDEAIVNWGYQKQFGYSPSDSLQVWKDYQKVFEELIPQTLSNILPEDKNIYWPSSPAIGWGHPESLEQGDSHYWGVWHGEEPLEIYNTKVGRFMSEYGFLSMPSLPAVDAMFSQEPVYELDNPVIKTHQKHLRGWQLIDLYMKRDYRVPSDFVQYAYVSQLLQARAVQTAIEAHRRNQPYNRGTLYWQFNDVWPVASWSAVDYTGHFKALYYQSVRSFRPQVLLAYEKDRQVELFAVNDALQTYNNIKLKLELKDFKNNIINTLNKKIKTPLTDILRLETIPLQDLIPEGTDRSAVYLQMELRDKDNQLITSGLHYFVRPKALRLIQPAIQINKGDDAYTLEISTDVLAKNVYLIGNQNFSDNFFDLLPGEKRIIKAGKPIDSVRVISLWNTLQ